MKIKKRRDGVTKNHFFSLLAVSSLILAGALVLFSVLPGESATAKSSGYLVGRGGETSLTAITVSQSSPGENVPIRLYFSNENLRPYFEMSSRSSNWNGGGFVGLTKDEVFYIETGRVSEDLMFENHTVWVEIGGAGGFNETIRFFPVPGPFYKRGREVPPGVAATRSSRQTTVEIAGRDLPIEVEVLVW